MRRLVPLLLSLSLAVAGPAIAQKTDDAGAVAADGGNISMFSEDDRVMNAAIAQAQATLPVFLAQVLDANGQSRGGAVKVSFQTFPQDVGDEIIWVNGFSRQPDGSFTGFLSNQPVNLGHWQEGTQVQFPQAAIQDWSLHDASGRMLGNYTTRVIAAQPENTYLWDYLAPDPVPSSWQ